MWRPIQDSIVLLIRVVHPAETREQAITATIYKTRILIGVPPCGFIIDPSL